MWVSTLFRKGGPTMANRTRFDRAIRWCVRSALRGPKTPLATLATLLDELRQVPSWNARDVRKVQTVAFHRLVQPRRPTRQQFQDVFFSA
jgi:hypothetical protein